MLFINRILGRSFAFALSLLAATSILLARWTAPDAPISEDDRKAAEKTYRELYGSEHDRIADSKDGGEKVRFAKKLAEAVKVAQEKPALAQVLRLRAADFALADPAGYPLALDLLRVSLNDPGTKLAALQKLTDVLDKIIPLKPTAQREHLAEELFESYRDLAVAYRQAGEFDAARKTLAQAGPVVKSHLKSARELLDDLATEEALIGIAEVEQQRFTEATTTLKTTPDDPIANRIVGVHHLIHESPPAMAVMYLLKSKEPTYQKLGEALSASGISELDRADAYYAAAEAAADRLTQRTLYRLAGEQFELALELGSAKGDESKARLYLAKIRSLVGPRTIDLLKLMNPIRNDQIVRGKWRFVGKALVSPLDDPARIQIPYVPPEEYLLRVVAEPRVDELTLAVGVVVPRSRCLVIFNSWPQFGWKNAIDKIDDKDPNHREEGVFQGRVLMNRKVSEIVCGVRKSGINACVDGRALLHFNGDYKRLSVDPGFEVPNKHVLFLGTWKTSYHITAIELTPISGHGWVVE